MKKKLIATLVAGAVLSTGIIGLTACGGGLSINKGEEVDEAGWKAAYTATIQAKNFTVDSYQEETVKMKGSAEELGLDKLDITVKSTSESKIYFDQDSYGLYSKTTAKEEASGVPDALKDEYKSSEYKVENYTVKESETLYSAAFYGYREDAEWEVAGYPVEYAGILSNPLASYLNESFATEKGGAAKNCSELYGSFKYSGGVYTATLYNDDGIEMKVSVSVKGGFMVGLAYEYTYSMEEGGSSYSETSKVVCNLSNYGSTTVTPSDDAKKAVDDYKASQN